MSAATSRSREASISTISYRHHERLQAGQIAAALAATGFVALGALQLALALGAPFGHAAWGGGSVDLTSAQRLGSAVSVVLYASAAAVVLARVGLTRRPRSRRLLRWSPWVLAVLFAVSALANFASQSHWENYLLGPTLPVVLRRSVSRA
jgi:hypothetical protein